MSTLSNPRNRLSGSPLVVAAIVVIVAFFLIVFAGQFYYAFERVNEQEVGVKFQGGKIKDIVGPGVYSDVGLYVDLQRVSSQGIPFSVEDSELITKDKQRIGLVVSGDIFRPGVNNKDTLRTLWAQYRGIYLDDQLASSRVEDLARQAMKVCVGDRTFDDSVVGTARDVLRACIDTEVSELANNFGLTIENVVVPNVILSPDVQVALDAIVASRLETEKAAQDTLRASAQADAEQARQEGEIRVAQSRIQEQARQETTLAKLQQERVLALRVVIEAEKSNELFAAQQDLEINRAKAEAALELAKAEIASEAALAQLYNTMPAYVALLLARANASALNQTDKVIFVPEGTAPTIVLPGPGIVPTVNTGGQ